ncbi:MAG: hypothetical protein ABL982_23035, partial [Vicinamibacterales bacterium]
MLVGDDVEDEVDDRSGEAGTIGCSHVPIVQMKPTGAKDLGRESELLPPVGDNRSAEEAISPGVHFRCNLFG